jgi:NADH-quinone oxidoreductase subunit E
MNRTDEIIEAHRDKPGSLIRVLIEIQHAHRWLPRDALEKVADTLGVPLSQVMQVATG